MSSSKLSPATIDEYQRIVYAFRDWYAAQYGDAPDMASLTDDVIDHYLRWSAVRVGPATCRKRRAALHWTRAISAHAKEQT